MIISPQDTPEIRKIITDGFPPIKQVTEKNDWHVDGFDEAVRFSSVGGCIVHYTPTRLVEVKQED